MEAQIIAWVSQQMMIKLYYMRIVFLDTDCDSGKVTSLQSLLVRSLCFIDLNDSVIHNY